MKIYFAGEKCRECDGIGWNQGPTYDDACPRCNGVGLKPGEFSVIGAIDHDTDDFLDYRKHPEWAELQNDELVYRMEEVEL